MLRLRRCSVSQTNSDLSFRAAHLRNHCPMPMPAQHTETWPIQHRHQAIRPTVDGTWNNIRHTSTYVVFMRGQSRHSARCKRQTPSSRAAAQATFMSPQKHQRGRATSLNCAHKAIEVALCTEYITSTFNSVPNLTIAVAHAPP